MIKAMTGHVLAKGYFVGVYEKLEQLFVYGTPAIVVMSGNGDDGKELYRP